MSSPLNSRCRALLLVAATVAASCPPCAGADTRSAPALLNPGVVSTGDSESHATLSPDGRTLYYVKLTPDFAHWTIVVSKRVQAFAAAEAELVTQADRGFGFHSGVPLQ